MCIDFEAACIHGDIEKVKLLRSNADNLVTGFLNACFNGHIEIVEFLISLSKNWTTDAWDTGLGCACKFGHINIVNLMILKGAEEFIWARQIADHYGHNDIVNLLTRVLVSRGNKLRFNAQEVFEKDIKMLSEVMNKDLINYTLINI
jgi:ankyrin repeat protein